jgi:glutathionyl-hydroquinone reductase
MIGWVYEDINNGAHRCGFATEHEVYEGSVVRSFVELDRVEGRFYAGSG